MPWTNQELQSHLRAAKLLDKIKNQTFGFIRKNPGTTEQKVRKYIRKLFKENQLRLAKDSPIVAFGKNTSEVHHFSTSNSQRLTPNTPILIDLWTRQNKKSSPFADITWMGFHGHKIPSEFQKIFQVVINASDACLKHLKTQLLKGKIPTGAELDKVTRGIIKKSGYDKNFTHSTGHSLGFSSPHGKEKGINYKNDEPLEKNLGYTIEPGIYLKNKYGARSEIDFYINSQGKIVITTGIQKELVIIKSNDA